jgi:hypothetical protein
MRLRRWGGRGSTHLAAQHHVNCAMRVVAQNLRFCAQTQSPPEMVAKGLLYLLLLSLFHCISSQVVILPLAPLVHLLGDGAGHWYAVPASFICLLFPFHLHSPPLHIPYPSLSLPSPSLLSLILRLLNLFFGINNFQRGYGIEYAFNLEIGSPVQLLPVVLDSGSPGVCSF